MLPDIQRLYLQENCQTVAFVLHQEGPEIPKLASLSLEQISKLPPESITLPAAKDCMHLSIDPALTKSAVPLLIWLPNVSAFAICSQCTPSCYRHACIDQDK